MKPKSYRKNLKTWKLHIRAIGKDIIKTKSYRDRWAKGISLMALLHNRPINPKYLEKGTVIKQNKLTGVQ